VRRSERLDLGSESNLQGLYQVLEALPGDGVLGTGGVVGIANTVPYVGYPAGAATDWITPLVVRPNWSPRASLRGTVVYTSSGAHTANPFSVDVQVRPIVSGTTGTPSAWGTVTLSLPGTAAAGDRLRSDFVVAGTPAVQAEGWAVRLRRNVDLNITELRVQLLYFDLVEAAA
jgi:hypothetical protein